VAILSRHSAAVTEYSVRHSSLGDKFWNLQYIDESLPALLQKSGKGHGISCGLESGHLDLKISETNCLKPRKISNSIQNIKHRNIFGWRVIETAGSYSMK